MLLSDFCRFTFKLFVCSQQKVKPVQTLRFDAAGFSVEMSGGPKAPKVVTGAWNTPLDTTHPGSGRPGVLTFHYTVDPSLSSTTGGGITIYNKMEMEGGKDVANRSINEDGELLLTMGPRLSRDGKSEVRATRFFRRK